MYNMTSKTRIYNMKILFFQEKWKKPDTQKYKLICKIDTLVIKSNIEGDTSNQLLVIKGEKMLQHNFISA